MTEEDADKKERLHKVLAHAGVASRRRCEDLIREGRVKVNGRVVREMGVQVDPLADEIRVDGEVVKQETRVHLLVYKPRDYLCTTSDQWGRRTILDLVPSHRGQRLFTVGRLDLDAEGLVIVTNDGDFAHEVLHPRRRLARTYWVKVRGHVGPEVVRRAREGVWLSDGRTPPMDVTVQRAGREVSTAKCTLVERHHHQLKRTWARLGTPVQRMVLVRIATIGTEGLKKGRFRPLTPAEVEELRSGPPAPHAEPLNRRRREPRPKPRPEGPVAWGTPSASFDAEREEARPHSKRRPPRGPGRPGRPQRKEPPRPSSSGRAFRKRGR
jgi:pseudouridine synthase